MRSQPPAPTWAEYMRTDIRALVDCEVIALLPGWGQSRGARREVSIADELGMPRMQIQNTADLPTLAERAANPSTTSK